MAFAALVVLGYLLGSCPWGYWLVRLVKHEDIRTVGSGNIGATNVWRTYGRYLGAPVVLLDVLKGFVPALLGMLYVPPHHLSGITAGAAAMLGHWRPLFLRFAKGGKMVATCGGVFFGVAPLVAVAAGVVWLIVFLALRYASLASMAAGIALPVFAYLLGYPTSVVLFGAAAAAAILFLHRANLARLRAGTESRFHFRRAVAPSFPPTTRLRCARMRKGSLLVVLAVSLWCAPGALAAGWCGGSTEAGADRPDLLTGQQVHAVVAIPSDGVDTFAAESAASPTTSRRSARGGRARIRRESRASTRPPSAPRPAPTSRSCASGAAARPTRRPARQVRSSASQRARARRARQLVQEVPRLLRRPIGAGECLRDGWRRLQLRPFVRDHLAARVHRCPERHGCRARAPTRVRRPARRCPPSVPANRRRQRSSV